MDETDQGAAETEHPNRRFGPRTPRGRVARQLARRRRRERLIGVLIAGVGVVVLIVAFVALRHPHQSGTAAGSDTRKTTPSQGPTVLPSSSAKSSPSPGSSGSAIGSKPLIVLNQTTTSDLAAQAAQRFRSGGWQVSSTQEGYQNDVLTTTAYYDPSVPGALRAANALRKQYSTIHRVAQRFAQLPAGPVVVVLTTDYSST